MQGLIFPGILLLLVALWGVFSSGRKFRLEFKKRGKTWEEVSAAMTAGEGLLVVDMVWGPQRGLGHPAIWWLPRAVGENDDLTPALEPGGMAMLVKCPRHLRSLEALRKNFAPEKVRCHGWDVGTDLTKASSPP